MSLHYSIVSRNGISAEPNRGRSDTICSDIYLDSIELVGVAYRR